MSKKKNIITLDLEDDCMQEDVAHLLFRSPQPGYLFTDNMNKLYGFGLHRIEDMELDGAIDHLKYYLIEKPRTATPGSAWGIGDKLLIIKGEGAQDMADYICEEFSDPLPAESGNLLAEEHARLRDEMLADFTVVTKLDLGATPPPTQKRRTVQERMTLEQMCAAIHAYIEIQRLDIADQ